jgi:hypothetical protein
MSTERKPHVDPLVPTVSVKRWLGRIHVGTPDSEIMRMLEEQMATQTDPRWTPTIKRQTIRFALWQHHRNIAEYVAVMGGRR